MSIDSLIAITHRQGTPAQILFIIEQAPLVGAVASIPGILLSLVLTVAKASQAAFNAIQARFYKPQDDYQIRQAQLKQDAADWGVIFLNQIANLCTVGILNNVIVYTALRKLGREIAAADL